MEKLIMEVALSAEIDINYFFSQMPSVSKERAMRVSIATELLLRMASESGIDLDLSLDFSLLHQAIIFYDIGFMLIPNALLNKEEEMTAAEHKVLQRHGRYGAKLLEKYYMSSLCPVQEKEFWQLASETAISHHERWDGKGYPFGLLTTATPIISRAVAITDTYSSIVSGAIHRMALPHEYAVLEISDNRGTQFDPQLVNLFVKNCEEFHRIFSMEITTETWETYFI